MTDDEKLAKIGQLENKAWTDGWTKWESTGWQSVVNENLETIERCQRIRANIGYEQQDRARAQGQG